MNDQVPDLPDPSRPGRRGLWLAEYLTAELTLDSTPAGLTATVTALLPSGESQ